MEQGLADRSGLIGRLRRILTDRRRCCLAPRSRCSRTVERPFLLLGDRWPGRNGRRYRCNSASTSYQVHVSGTLAARKYRVDLSTSASGRFAHYSEKSSGNRRMEIKRAAPRTKVLLWVIPKFARRLEQEAENKNCKLLVCSFDHGSLCILA